ncbi:MULTISPECIES: sensor histidine kinase [unclassified Rhizobium]|uniref:sensor histidine kinase n=1 Tax=unclassified Rhizobium TaxID=2613769 RepID=UPI001ADB688E|nr:MULTISPECIES: HAMP domain-containing sensor histidine kinase [unclassified Rhizobium]MBO9097333.1 HAMP domain-containing histidine kinase [Rhizobium sp. L58/93]MBO9133815.1 HAMP domain-containing histidine kinase [Rhizobium sp. B209b/85]MBO9167572.1 HAMP domain-containing histidine kinase [Rhizobium sp. L245/93]MBO9183531.1 HAMP domain-containing histidine kinase [Rhizobium sp. E27B/91]QXZ83861.1 HAMP domain-containing histidine kinase [Rhizobium sp. K1/93]
MTRATLTSKLYLRIIPVIVIAISVIGLLAFKSARHEIDNIYDAQLINEANVLWGLLQRPLLRQTDDPPRRIDDIDFKMDNQLSFNQDADDYADAHMVRAWKDGKIQVFSSTAFQADMPEQKAGFHTINYKGERWRVYALPIPNTTIAMEVGEKIALRDRLISNILRNLVFPLFILLPIIAFLIWLGINRGLAPMSDFVRQIRLRSPDDLSAIPVEGLPLDLMPLGTSINQLLDKLGHSLTLERRFSDLVAHELRTPQAGVKLLLQMLRDTEAGRERDAIVADLVESNNRAMHLIEQLLRLARVSHHPLKLGAVPLYHLVASIAAGFGSRITAKRLDLSLQGSEDAEVLTDESLLQLMISNLLDNALKYTPEDGRVEVTIMPEGEAWFLSIDDTGPGIPADQRSAVFQRFYRVDSPQEQGSGLGLAIVADVATRLAVTIELSTPSWGYGLSVRVRLPAPA